MSFPECADFCNWANPLGTLETLPVELLQAMLALGHVNQTTPAATQCGSLFLVPELCNLGANECGCVLLYGYARAPTGRELPEALLGAVVPALYLAEYTDMQILSNVVHVSPCM